MGKSFCWPIELEASRPEQTRANLELSSLFDGFTSKIDVGSALGHQVAPRDAQERSGSAPGAPKEHPGEPQGAPGAPPGRQRGARGSQKASRGDQKACFFHVCANTIIYTKMPLGA